MAYQNPEIRKFSGLKLQKNSFNVSDGSLEVADNVIISKDDVISKRRGFYQYFDPTTDTLNALTYFNSKLIAVMTNKVRYIVDTGSTPNFTGSATTLAGVTVSVTAPRKAKFAQSNKNLYFTTDNGVLKLEDFNSSVFSSGVPPALDITGAFYNLSTYSVSPDATIGYRVVFGRKDANSNVLLGSPSDMIFLTNGFETGKAYSRTTTVVTVTSTAHGLVVGQSVKITTVVLSTGTPIVAEGTYAISAVTTNTFDFTEGSGSATGTLSYSASKNTRLEFSVPSEITSTSQNFFYQVYRTSQASSSATISTPDFKLVEEVFLTSSEITNKVVYYSDVIDQLLVANSPELYTNTNSKEGETQANDRAPKCKDLALYKGILLYANCITRHLLNIQLVDISSLTSGDYVEVKVGGTTRRYVGRTGVGNTTTAATASGTGTVTITSTAHNLSNGDVVYVSNVVGTVPEGEYTVSGVTANTFAITSASNTASTLDFYCIRNSTPHPIFTIANSSSSLSVNLRLTAKALVKAINRDSSSLIYARYTSSAVDTPGKIRLTAKGFTDPIYLAANSIADGASFSPALPDSFASGTQVFSTNDSLTSSIFASKQEEPEAVPIVNQVNVGAKNKAILAIRALRDSAIVIKEDGIFRLTGDTVSTLSVTPLDTTVICVAENSVDVINNQVTLLSNQGVCLVTESTVRIVSRDIENVIQPILGNANISAQTSGVAYESERLYLLSTLELNQNALTTTYCFNLLTEQWTKWDQLFTGAVLGSNDTLYLITNNDLIFKERKNQTKIDFCGQNYSLTVVSVASDMLSAVVTISVVPEIGDVIIKDDVFNKILSVTVSNSNYIVTFQRDCNLAASDSTILYSKYNSIVKFSPIHLGKVGLMKQFAEMQIHIRDSNLSRLDISFAGYVYGSSELVTWNSLIFSEGFGFFPFAFEPFGQPDGILTTPGTEPSPVIRVWVPRFQQRTTFIQPYIEHYMAGESMNIQAVSFSVRTYQERVTR